jgi:2-polyprenyl-3-methyl-5-hydroxy-6-metoxy-1,4-benzoquinol methylase
MINASAYHLQPSERIAIEELLAQVGVNPSLEQLWALMDQAWEECCCDANHPDPQKLAAFYSDPIWLLNGMFIEQHELSMLHRKEIAAAVAAVNPQRVLDFGGGFGTLARLLAAELPHSQILICEPYPPRHGIEACLSFDNIKHVSDLANQCVDVLVTTDVLEHVPDPLPLLAAMVAAVRPGGYLLFANCFHPVIKCHLPCTFHLRYSFDAFCSALGLELVGLCNGTHCTIYRRSLVLIPDWDRIRAMERRSQQLFPWRQWHARHISPWIHRAKRAITDPAHYPRLLLGALRPRC